MITKEKKKQRVIIISWAAVLIWMGLIFYLSCQAGEESSKLSAGITDAIVKAVKTVAPQTDMDIDTFNHLLRKNAHFFSYFVLGLLVMNALSNSGIRGFRCIVLALGVSILYAVSDEVHQLFVPGRAGQFRDVLIDSAGAAIGTFLYKLFEKRISVLV